MHKSKQLRNLILPFFLLAFVGNADVLAQQKEWMLGPFTRPKDINPIITPNDRATFRDPITTKKVKWESMATFNPAAIVKEGKIHVLYRAEEKLGEKEIGGHTSRLGMAVSTDGLTYKRNPQPVFYPANDGQKKNEWPGGVEDPRIVQTADGLYVLTYTQWNRDIPRLAVATSRDLVKWEKHGPAFAKALEGKYLNFESKSGAILTHQEGNKLVPTMVNGKYWMYFGVPFIGIATSSDLINWEPLEDGEGKLLHILSPRVGYFDAWLVEAGPPALMTEHGIVVLYNAGNSAALGDTLLGDRVYSGGQALYDLKNPMKLLARSEEPFIKPEMPYEKSGQYKDGTTFLEGLVFFQDKWFLYYGTADSRVGVVVWDPKE